MCLMKIVESRRSCSHIEFRSIKQHGKKREKKSENDKQPSRCRVYLPEPNDKNMARNSRIYTQGIN